MGIISYPPNVLENLAGVPMVSPQDYNLDAAKGKIPGVSCIHKFGHNATVGLTEEDVWTTGGVHAWLSANTAMEVVSSGVDTSSGAGARTIFIEGLDGSFNPQSETVTLNAGTQATANSYTRINRAYVTSSGTYHGTNVNDVVIRVASAGAVQATIAALQGQTEKTQYTIPAGHTGYLTKYSASIDGVKPGNITLYQYQNADDWATGFDGGRRIISSAVGVSGFWGESFDCYPVLPEMTDIWVAGKGSIANTDMEATYDIFLVEN